MRRRLQILMFSMAVLMVVGTGAASAALLSGNSAPNTLTGKKQDDVIFGRSGNDFLYGRDGDDLLYGGDGSDYLSGDGGRDIVYSGPGRDQVYADDGARDLIFCGGSTDTVFADRIDSVIGCEIEGPVALKGGVLATFSAVGERFQIWVTNEQTIWELYRLGEGDSMASIPIGTILRGPGRAGHNAPYGWHFSPKNTSMAERTVEVCDGRPSYVEENTGEFVDNVGFATTGRRPPIGTILRGPGRAGHNAPYGWHFSPKNTSMAERTVEVCDGRPSYVEENTGEFVDNVGYYCPWSAHLVKLRNYTGEEIIPPDEQETPPIIVPG